MSYLNFWPYVVAIVVTLVIWLIYAVLSGEWSPLKLAEGADKRISLSKFQWLLWLWIIAFTYIAIYAARFLVSGGASLPMTDIPENILLILGFSTGTTVLAKGITQAYVANGALAKPEKPSGEGVRTSDLISDDTGFPDLSKLQMFIWTIIAVVIYIGKLVAVLSSAASAPDITSALGRLNIPDLDSSLMLLSGLSLTGYLGKKIVTKDAPHITSITPSGGIAGQDMRVMILGKNFGPQQNGSMLNAGPLLNLQTDAWTDMQISATFPATLTRGAHLISVIVGGVKSNEVIYQLT